MLPCQHCRRRILLVEMLPIANPGTTLLEWTRQFVTKKPQDLDLVFWLYKKNRKNIEVFFYFDEMFVSACCHSQRERHQKGGDKNVHATSTSILQKRSFCWFWIHLCQHRLTGDLYLCVRGLCASETKHMYVCDGACGFLFSFPLPCFGLISSCLHFSLLLRLPAPPWLPLEVHSDSL